MIHSLPNPHSWCLPSQAVRRGLTGLAGLLLVVVTGSLAGAATDAGATGRSLQEAMPAGCPLHAAHMAAAGVPAEAGRRELDRRGELHMGFSQDLTRHTFRLLADGGVIEVRLRPGGDDETLQAVRDHLRHIATVFASGDFSIPRGVHATVPPGSEAMARLADGIDYRYEQLEAGGRLRITAGTPEALAAVHEFLRFQIEDHGTGDPIE
jgi:acetylornithine deacetylase/succinyl-diaminopimelate desuccinylase-like protein